MGVGYDLSVRISRETKCERSDIFAGMRTRFLRLYGEQAGGQLEEPSDRYAAKAYDRSMEPDLDS